MLLIPGQRTSSEHDVPVAQEVAQLLDGVGPAGHPEHADARPGVERRERLLPALLQRRADRGGPRVARHDRDETARGGTPDNLKLIVGIGPKLEALCHKLGFFHFDQIAAWSPAEVAWVNSRLGAFRHRIEREHWIDQARKLMEK